MELTNCGIPFNITSGLRFFEQAHIKDVAAFMKLAVNLKDEVAFKRIARLPGIGVISASKLWLEWLILITKSDDPPISFSEHLEKFKVPSKSKNTWIQFGYTMDELCPDGELALQEMISSILGGVYDDYMRSKFTNYTTESKTLNNSKDTVNNLTIRRTLGQLALLSGVEGEPSKITLKTTNLKPLLYPQFIKQKVLNGGLFLLFG